jgi:hypothetical protein
MTIYRIYIENGSRADFWVQHRSWQNLCGVVRSVAGQQHGMLPGQPPLYDRAAMTIDMYDIRSGRPVPVIAATAPDDRNFSRIAKPAWYRSHN